jgi:uncharacterized protein (TIGR00369 family)
MLPDELVALGEQKPVLKLPPPVFLEMGGEFVTVDTAVSPPTLTVRFPVEARFQNPLGYMQGGIIAALVDNTIGPLSFMVAPPSVTKTLLMEYVRPIPPEMAQVVVQAWAVRIEARELELRAEVRNEAGEILSKATAVHTILKPRP